MYKRIILLLIVFLIGVVGITAEKSYTLKAGVSMVDKVPKAFYGTWRVKSTLVSTNNNQIFKQSTVDLWNLSRSGNVITLNNPFTGATASIVLAQVKDKVIRFQKTGDYDGKKLTDVVQLKLSEDIFSGENYLTLETASESYKATYHLSGEKISGSSIK